MGAMGPFLTPNLDFLTPKSQQLTPKYLTLALQISMGWRKPPKSPIWPQKPHKKPYKRRAVNGCEKTPNGPFLIPKLHIFTPKFPTFTPNISLWPYTNLWGRKIPKIPYSQPQKPHKKPYKRNGDEWLRKDTKIDHFRSQNRMFWPQNHNNWPQNISLRPYRDSQGRKIPKIPYSQPQKPHKKPYNRKGGEWVGIDPKIGHFWPQNWTFLPQNLKGWPQNTSLWPYTNLWGGKNPKNPIFPAPKTP